MAIFALGAETEEAADGAAAALGAGVGLACCRKILLTLSDVNFFGAAADVFEAPAWVVAAKVDANDGEAGAASNDGCSLPISGAVPGTTDSSASADGADSGMRASTTSSATPLDALPGWLAADWLEGTSSSFCWLIA